ncbi:MAG: hypothetical protein K2J11_04510, partial [Oscillospiraceae bacterium]|nr:hypothetical protein [Oscillospiraceae bacterium]
APRPLETSPAGLSWTSFSRRLRRLSVTTVSLVNQNLSVKIDFRFRPLLRIDKYFKKGYTYY